MLEDIKSLISEIIDISMADLTYESGPLSHPEWDSLAHLCIVSAIEDKYKIKIKMNQIIEIKNIRDIENIIKEN